MNHNGQSNKRSEEKLDDNGSTSSTRPQTHSIQAIQGGLAGTTGRDDYHGGLARSTVMSNPRQVVDDDAVRSVVSIGHRSNLVHDDDPRKSLVQDDDPRRSMVHDDDPPKRAGPGYDDDPVRSSMGLVDMYRSTDNYHDDPVRSLKIGPVQNQWMASMAPGKQGVQMAPNMFGGKHGIRMAPTGKSYNAFSARKSGTGSLGGDALPMRFAEPLPVQKQEPFGDQAWLQTQQRLLDEYQCYDDDMQADESDDMMMEEEQVIYNKDGIPALPSYYRRDSTYRVDPQIGGRATVTAIQEVLVKVRQDMQCYMDFRTVGPNQTEIEGEFHSNRAICEFVISTYAGSDADPQIWVEFRNLSCGIDAAQAYATLFHQVTNGLIKKNVLTELVDPTFQPYCAMEDPPRVDQEEARIDDEEVKSVLADRFRELKASNYLMNQRALTEEIMYVAEDYAGLVAEIPGVASQLANLLKKNAKQDSQVSKTVLNLVRTLIQFDSFVVELKNEEKKLTRAMIEAAESTNSRAWQRDIVDTLQGLQKVGIQCSSKKDDATYRRIQARLEAMDVQL